MTRRSRRSWPLARGAVLLATAGVFGFLILPVTVIVALSFTADEYLRFPPSGFSLRWYRAVWQSPEWLGAFGVSVRVAAATTLAATALSVLSAFALVRGTFRWKRMAYMVLLAPLMFPTIISAIGLHFLFSRLNLIGTAGAIVLGHTVLALPVATILVVGAMRGFDVRLEQAALSMGASRWLVFRRITLPLIAPGVVSAALFAFLTSFEELLVPLFVAGPFTETLPLKIWHTLMFGIEPTITAVSAVLVGLTVAILGGSALINRAPRRP